MESGRARGWRWAGRRVTGETEWVVAEMRGEVCGGGGRGRQCDDLAAAAAKWLHAGNS